LTGVKFADRTAKSRDETLIQALLAGSWTSVPLVLDGVPASELGFVRVKNIIHTGISLRSSQ